MVFRKYCETRLKSIGNWSKKDKAKSDFLCQTCLFAFFQERSRHSFHFFFPSNNMPIPCQKAKRQRKERVGFLHQKRERNSSDGTLLFHLRLLKNEEKRNKKGKRMWERETLIQEHEVGEKDTEERKYSPMEQRATTIEEMLR